MEAICSSETSVDILRNTRRYIPKYGTLHNYRSGNLKSYKVLSELTCKWYVTSFHDSGACTRMC
jgi:hypothetical protein